MEKDVSTTARGSSDAVHDGNSRRVAFTPGPWTRLGQDGITTEDLRYGIVAVAYANVGPDDEPAQREANTRLIAAAPELFEAAAILLAANKAVDLALCEDPGDPSFDPMLLPAAQEKQTEAERLVEAVLAKATGTENPSYGRVEQSQDDGGQS